MERPIVLRWAVGAARTLVGRTFIVLDDGAQASVVEELVESDEVVPGAYGLLSATTEIRLGANARLAMASLQELGPDHVAFQQRLAHIGEGADLRWALAQLGARLVRSRVDNVLAGDRSTVEQVEIVFGIEDQLHDLTSYTRHQGRDTTGQLLAKGVLMDNARSYMKGLISIEKTAIGTDSYLGEFGMNLSKTARAVAIPSLEIDQPDCRRAMHSSSVGPIDEIAAVLPREPRHRARRGAQVHRARLPRAGRRPGPARGRAGPAARGARGEMGRGLRCRTGRRRDGRGLTPRVPIRRRPPASPVHRPLGSRP